MNESYIDMICRELWESNLSEHEYIKNIAQIRSKKRDRVNTLHHLVVRKLQGGNL